jgi:hypothetical protein
MKRSRREFLQVAGVAVPSLTLLAQRSTATDSMFSDDVEQQSGSQPPEELFSPSGAESSSELRAHYEAAYNRLKDQYSLERVAADRIEVRWEDLLGMASPLSKQIPVHAPFHYDMTFVHPDLSITLGREANSLALGFALGEPPQFPNMWEVERELHKGYQPIIRSNWRNGSLELQQVAFGFLPKDAAVVSGRETQYVMVRIRVMNRGRRQQTTNLNLFVGKAGILEGNTGGHLTSLSGAVFGASHHRFTASKARWRIGPIGLQKNRDALFIGDRPILTYRCSTPVEPSFREEFDPGARDSACSDAFGNCLQFKFDLAPDQIETVEIVARSAPLSRQFVRKDYYEKKAVENEYDDMTAITFAQALQRAEAQWDSVLSDGMKLTTPEPRLNNIFKGLILSGFTCISKSPDHDWIEPYQTPFLWEVLPWEQAFHMNALNSVGFSKVTKQCLVFFTEQQVGIGPQSANHGPLEAKSISGTYPGQASGDWMNFTGSTLWMLASYYQYTKDKDWLRKNSRGILAAWDWIQSERARTRVKTAAGKRVDHYGLLPPGRAGDWPEGSYLFTFTDNYTWYGMSEIAKCFQDAGLSESSKLIKEAEEYRQCILNVMHQEETIDSETGQLFVPNAVGFKRGYRASWWMADGPVQMFRTGLLKPNDKRFAATFEITKRKHGVLLGMHETYGHPEWYNNQTDHTFYRCYLVRDEFEKALLTYYSSLVYGLSHDCFQTQERTTVYDPNAGTYHINASNIGRILEMMKTMVVDEQESGTLWLLRGCPRRWLSTGQSIQVEDAPTVYGKLNLMVDSTSAGEIKVEFSLDNSASFQLPNVVLIRVAHPTRKTIQKVVVNGKNWTRFNAKKEAIEIRPTGGRQQVVVHY